MYIISFNEYQKSALQSWEGGWSLLILNFMYSVTFLSPFYSCVPRLVDIAPGIPELCQNIHSFNLIYATDTYVIHWRLSLYADVAFEIHEVSLKHIVTKRLA